MKSSIHPKNYRPVVFSDDVAGFKFLTQSTAQTDDTIKWEDGNEYPLVKVHISSASHPFFTGEEYGLEEIRAIAAYEVADEEWQRILKILAEEKLVDLHHERGAMRRFIKEFADIRGRYYQSARFARDTSVEAIEEERSRRFIELDHQLRNLEKAINAYLQERGSQLGMTHGADYAAAFQGVISTFNKRQDALDAGNQRVQKSWDNFTDLLGYNAGPDVSPEEAWKLLEILDSYEFVQDQAETIDNT